MAAFTPRYVQALSLALSRRETPPFPFEPKAQWVTPVLQPEAYLRGQSQILRLLLLLPLPLLLLQQLLFHQYLRETWLRGSNRDKLCGCGVRPGSVLVSCDC
jgi:hypothetical protein